MSVCVDRWLDRDHALLLPTCQDRIGAHEISFRSNLKSHIDLRITLATSYGNVALSKPPFSVSFKMSEMVNMSRSCPMAISGPVSSYWPSKI